MNAKTLLKLLEDIKNGARSPDSVGDIPFSRTIFQAIVSDPHASIIYITERMTKRFAKRHEIGEHLDAFAEKIGLTRTQVDLFNQAIKLYTRRTQESLDREKGVKETFEYRRTRLDAVVSVIYGYGSVRDIEATTGVNHRVIYRLLQEYLAEEDLTLADLRALPTPKRKVLGDRIFERQYASIEQTVKDRVRGDGPYKMRRPRLRESLSTH